MAGWKCYYLLRKKILVLLISLLSSVTVVNMDLVALAASGLGHGILILDIWYLMI